jgi:hypothetical protein
MEMLLSILFHLNLSNTIDVQSGMSIVDTCTRGGSGRLSQPGA